MSAWLYCVPSQTTRHSGCFQYFFHDGCLLPLRPVEPRRLSPSPQTPSRPCSRALLFSPHHPHRWICKTENSSFVFFLLQEFSHPQWWPNLVFSDSSLAWLHHPSLGYCEQTDPLSPAWKWPSDYQTVETMDSKEIGISPHFPGNFVFGEGKGFTFQEINLSLFYTVLTTCQTPYRMSLKDRQWWVVCGGRGQWWVCGGQDHILMGLLTCACPKPSI